MRLAWAEFELDEPRFELRKQGRVVAVQPKVLDLVLYLAKHRARVVGKDELLEQVWHDVTVTEASLSQAVSLARRALDDTPEAQHTIRTVRGRGFQFVATARELGSIAPPVSAPASAPKRVLVPAHALGSSVAETFDETPPKSLGPRTAPCLFVMLHSDAPWAGGARHLLVDVDEVVLTRGSEWRHERSGGSTRTLTLRMPGPLVSREHARITRARDGWYLVDEGSRNGTFVNRERMTKAKLAGGELIGCGRTLLRFETIEAPDGFPADSDLESGREPPLRSLVPGAWALSRDLARIATSALPILLLGEPGIGKQRAARAIHKLSGRSGPFQVVDGQGDRGFSGAPGGTLCVAHADRLSADGQAALMRALNGGNDVRFVVTATALATELASRLAGFRAQLPPLRERMGDIGCLVAELAGERGVAPFELTVPAAHRLLRYTWPGNVRELDRALQVALALADGAPVDVPHLPTELRDG